MLEFVDVPIFMDLTVCVYIYIYILVVGIDNYYLD